jgi:prevent-host-death family protein
MPAVGIRELKSGLSKYLKRVAHGERITVTERGRPVAVLVPIEEPSAALVQAMIAAGTARWSGGKPRGSARPARLRSGPSVAQAITEDRG